MRWTCKLIYMSLHVHMSLFEFVLQLLLIGGRFGKFMEDLILFKPNSPPPPKKRNERLD